MTVESMATSPVVSMRAIRIGPRSERNPTAGVTGTGRDGSVRVMPPIL